MGGKDERTYIMVKPDGVQLGLVGEIIKRFENRGYQLVALKLVQPDKAHLEVHYRDHKAKPFFGGLVEYMGSGPVAAMVWQGKDAVKTGHAMLGATRPRPQRLANPLASNPGTIRGDFSIDLGKCHNLCHGSDSMESAEREINHWFKKEELVAWTPAIKGWVYE